MNKSRKPECTDLSHDDMVKDLANDLKKWLQKKAKDYDLTYLLAHADDGVIWGEFRKTGLVTSQDAFPELAQLRLCTLQQCRIFGNNTEVFENNTEVMLWKVGQDWKARLIQDGNLSAEDYICEKQILWGTKLEGEPKKGFTLVSDGSEGLRHAVPLTLTKENFQGDNCRPLRLEVRHYIDYDQETGVARIYLSRLVNLFPTR